MSSEDSLSLGQAVSQYLAALPAAEKEAAQVEVTLFARWYGWNSPAGKLSPPQVAQYAERVEASVPDPARKLEPVRSFLAYLKKQGITQTNLSVHLKLKKTPGKPMPARGRARQQVTLTPEGRRELEVKLEALRAQRPRIVEAVQLARADKDFRENAPLDAAREHHAQVESRIRELEDTLKSDKVVEKEKEKAAEAGISVVMGSTVTLRDLASGEELRYAMVSPREASPDRGRVSVASPLGLALRGHQPGDEIEVKAPAGTMRYRIERVER